MARIYGGRKRDFKSKKDYQAHLRQMALQGRSFEVGNQTWGSANKESWMWKHLVSGYNFR
jgi:allantoicase